MDHEYLANLLFPSVTDTIEDVEKRFPPRELKEGAIVSRMAPSPTGFVHLGNLVQGLTSERLAHQSGGVLFLRVEDTDRKREVKGAVEILIETLKHYGIRFDEGASMNGDVGEYGPYHQSKRAPIYHVYAKKLVKEGMAYPCFCTEEELESMRAEQERESANFGYFGKWAKWRDRSAEDVEEMLKAGKPWVLRFRSTGSIENKFKFIDLIKGEVEVTENEIDHVLLKSDGIPTYHFAHAVDDHLMHTTHVVRGDEWLPSLPFHLQLFRALGFKIPKYCHIGPLMKMDGTSKRKLSKRKDPELALTYYKAEGFPVEAVYEYILTVLNSNFEDWRRANPDASTDEFKFSYKKMNPAGSLFDAAKLRDVSKNVISKMTAERVYDLCSEWAKEFDEDFYNHLSAEREKSLAVFDIGRGGNKPRKDYAVWSEMKEYMGFIFDDYFQVVDEADEKFEKSLISRIIGDYVSVYSAEDDQNAWFEKVKAVGEKYGFAGNVKDYKAAPENYAGSVADVSGFIRLAVTGKSSSPDMYKVMQILGEDAVKDRLKSYAENL